MSKSLTRGDFYGARGLQKKTVIGMYIPGITHVLHSSMYQISRVTGACPVTTDLIMRVNVRTTTTTTTTTRFKYFLVGTTYNNARQIVNNNSAISPTRAKQL